MPRRVTIHPVGSPAGQLSIFATDEPGAGGANHRYVVSGYDCTANPSGNQRVLHDTVIVFQNGVLKEAGVNGVTNEALLAIVEDRLAAFQAGKFACDENELALNAVQSAIEILGERTRRRTEAGIEGTHQEDAPVGNEPLSRDAKKLYDENFVETDVGGVKDDDQQALDRDKA